MTWLAHVLGIDDLSGRWYGLWSGFGSDLGEVAIVGGLASIVRHHTGFLEGAVEQVSVTSGSVAFNSEWDGSSLNTTTNWGIEIDCAWGSTTGSPTITCRGTLFERVG